MIKFRYTLVCALALMALPLAPPLVAAAEPVAGASADPASGLDAARLPSASQIDIFLASKGSPMAGQGGAFLASGARWGVDPRLLVAIAGAESSFGQITCAPFNAWGWGCPNGPYNFTSWADGIETVTSGLRRNYLSEGRTTVAAIHAKYAPVGAANDPTGLNNNWTINVSRFLIELGGDPADIDLDGVAGTYPVGVGGGALSSAIGSAYDATDGSTPTTGKGAAKATKVPIGGRAPMKIVVRNSGTATWDGTSVRLRRVDGEESVLTAPIAALNSGDEVAPNEVGTFTVQVVPVTGATGQVATRWQLEGPGGPVGSEIVSRVAISVSAFAAGAARVSAPRMLSGTEIGTVVAKFTNAGTDTWQNNGENAIFLTRVEFSGPPLVYLQGGAVGGTSEDLVVPMLERAVRPGETGTFAFRVRWAGGERGTSRLSVGLARAGAVADGDSVVLPIAVGP